MYILNEDFFDDENIMNDVSASEEQENITTNKNIYWYNVTFNCSNLKLDSLNREDFKKKWFKMFKAVPFVLTLNDFIDNASEIKGYVIHIDSGNRDYSKNNYPFTSIAEIYSGFRQRKIISLSIACEGLTLHKLRDKKTIRGVENITKWFAQCFNNIGLKNVKFTFGISLDINDLIDKNSHISVDSLPESTFKKLKFVESMIQRTDTFCGDEYTAKKQFGKVELSLLNNSFTLKLYRLVRNICITGEPENAKTYYMDEYFSNKKEFCKEEDLIHENVADTKKMLKMIIDSIDSEKHSIRPFYVKYSDESLVSIFSLNLVVTIDDERYLVHIENYYSRPNATNTLPSKLDKNDSETTKKYISQTKMITGSSEFEKFMKEDYSVPNNWKF